MEMQGFSATCLTVGQARELLGITEQKLDLKSRLVVAIDVQRTETDIGGEQQRRVRLIPVLFNQIHNADSPFEADAVDYGSIETEAVGLPGKFQAA
jgi:hypothetical protein